MTRNDIIRMLTDAIPFRIERKSAASWLVPAIAGMGVGLGAGLGLGLLLAPKAGSETRQQLREGATIVKDRVKERALMVANRSKEKVEEVSDAVQHGGRTFLNEVGSH